MDTNEKPFSYPSHVKAELLCSECHHSIDHHFDGCIHESESAYTPFCGCRVTRDELLANMKCLEFRAYIEKGKVSFSLWNAYHTYTIQEAEYMNQFLSAIIATAKQGK